MPSNVEHEAEALSSQCNTNNCTLNCDDVSLPTGPKENATGAAQQSGESGKEETSALSRLEPDVSDALVECTRSRSTLRAAVSVCDRVSRCELNDTQPTAPTAAQSPVGPEVQGKPNSNVDSDDAIIAIYQVRSVAMSSDA